jgi:hypothetical protein
MAAQEETADTTAASLPTDVSAHYVLVTPGETASSILGHAAIRMSCPSQGLDYCFTIKTPEIREEVIDMLFGHLRIGLVPEETSHFRQTYMKEGRGIIEYRLALSLDDTRRLWQQLDGQVARGLYLDLDYVNNSCTQVAIDQLYEQLRTRSDLQIDEVIRKTIPVQTRREAVLRYFDQSTWWGFLLHSCYSYYPDEKVSPRRLVVMPQDAAAVFREAGLVTEETVVAKQEKSAPSSGGAWLTPLLASALFFLLCLLPFRQVDWLAVPLQILSLLLFILLSVFSHASGIGFNWLILALFPLTAPVGIVYMLCHMGDIYSLAQLLFVLGFFVRALYYLYHHRNQVKKIILFKFINHSSI